MQHDEHNTPGAMQARSGIPIPIRRKENAPDPEEHMQQLLEATPGMPKSEAALRARAAERKRLKDLGLLEDPEEAQISKREVRLLRFQLTQAVAAQVQAQADLKAERRAHGRTQDKVYHLRCALTEARSLIQISPNVYRSGVETRQRLAAELAERETELAELRSAQDLLLKPWPVPNAPEPLEGADAQDILDRVRSSDPGPKTIEAPLDWEPPAPGGDGKRVPPDREGYTPEDAWHDYKMGD